MSKTDDVARLLDVPVERLERSLDEVPEDEREHVLDFIVHGSGHPGPLSPMELRDAREGRGSWEIPPPNEELVRSIVSSLFDAVAATD